MISRLDIDIPQRKFDNNKNPIHQYELTKEAQFFLFYTLLLILATGNSLVHKSSDGLMVFGSIIVNMNDIFMIYILSFSSMILASFLVKYFVIRFNLNSDILYGHLLAKESLEVFNMQLVYIEYNISYKDDSFLAGDDDYIDIQEEELYADDIYFLTNDKSIDFNDIFQNIEDYKCQKKEINLTFNELLEKYDLYNLDKIISKEDLKKLAIENKFHKGKEICIELSYILDDVSNRKDVVILDKQFIDDFRFDFQTFFTIIASTFILSLALYDAYFNTMQYYTALLSKTIQYNMFFYSLLLLTHMKYLYK